MDGSNLVTSLEMWEGIPLVLGKITQSYPSIILVQLNVVCIHMFQWCIKLNAFRFLLHVHVNFLSLFDI